MNQVCLLHIMNKKVQEKKKAIEMRKKGCSYKDILQEVDVAKSTLSNWLKNFPLTDDEKSVLKKRRDANISWGRIRAASVLRNNRLKREQKELCIAKDIFELHRNDPFFTTGIALYWAEGGKRSGDFRFTNSDEDMIYLMVLWINKYLNVPKEEIKCRLYLHAPYVHENLEQYWSSKIGISLHNFGKSIHKPPGLGIKKRPNYKGCLVLRLRGVYLLWRMKFFKELLVASLKEKI